MQTKAEVFPSDSQDNKGYRVCCCIKVGSYYQHFDKNQIYCKDKASVCEAVWNVLHNNICPECGHVFKGQNWEGVEEHWRSHHQQVMDFDSAWKLLSTDKYIEVMLESAE